MRIELPATEPDLEVRGRPRSGRALRPQAGGHPAGRRRRSPTGCGSAASSRSRRSSTSSCDGTRDYFEDPARHRRAAHRHAGRRTRPPRRGRRRRARDVVLRSSTGSRSRADSTWWPPTSGDRRRRRADDIEARLERRGLPAGVPRRGDRRRGQRAVDLHAAGPRRPGARWSALLLLLQAAVRNWRLAAGHGERRALPWSAA